MNLVYNESFNYLLYHCTNPRFGKNLVSNQIAGFLNQLYLQNKMMKKPDFLHVGTDSWKLKVKSYFNNFEVVMFKNGCDLLGLETLKSAVPQE